MTHSRMLSVATHVVVLFGACASVLVSAQEKTLTRAQLPAAVEKTVSAESKGATVQGFSTEDAPVERDHAVRIAPAPRVAPAAVRPRAQAVQRATSRVCRRNSYS